MERRPSRWEKGERLEPFKLQKPAGFSTTSTLNFLPSALYFWSVAKNRGDKTPLELFVEGLAGWDNGLKRELGQADQS